MNDDSDGRVRDARALDVLRDRPEWSTAVARLRQLHARDSAAAQEQAEPCMAGGMRVSVARWSSMSWPQGSAST